MWQKAIVKMAEDERNKFMLGKIVWVEARPSGDEEGRFTFSQFNYENPKEFLPTPFDKQTIDYKTNIIRDGDSHTRLGLAPHMLELLPEFTDNPEFVEFSKWSSNNA